MWARPRAQALTGTEPQPGRLSGTRRPQAGWGLPVPRHLPVSVEVLANPTLVPGVKTGPDWAGQAETVSSALSTAQGPE